ncbi:unnamed protein product [Toxocara canis]|uniref:Copine domain-containing protein n=1 Tax=Toxocara canis TaxID=6265 RepID=A0A183UHT0_TOXCA|nr:unnamed protein product [Toxocara canis]
MAVYSFLDYIVSGSLLHLAVAVDFSKAEQSPSHETTTDNTHSFVDDVEFVINAIVEPFRNYNFFLHFSSNNYAAFGFGARIPPLYRESHEFCLNLETDPYCRGIDGIIDAFRNAYTQVQSINSAHFAHVIYYVSKLAENARKRSNQARPQYFVLIIITRGAIDDLREAIQQIIFKAIIFASKAPLSIIFIGVGENNFMELERLGLSGARLAYHGRRADRDLLQFVSVSKFRTKDQSDEEARDSLVEKAIYQIPWQMATWMMKNGYIAQSTSDDLSEHKLSVGSAPTPRRTAAVLRYDSLINSYSSSSEQLDTPTTSEGTQLVREARRRDSDEQSDTCSTSSCPNPRASSASMLLDERMTSCYVRSCIGRKTNYAFSRIPFSVDSVVAIRHFHGFCDTSAKDAHAAFGYLCISHIIWLLSLCKCVDHNTSITACLPLRSSFLSVTRNDLSTRHDGCFKNR